VNPALPEGPEPDDPFGVDVGPFEQGTPTSRWALARYLVGRALGESISRSLLVVAVLILAFAGLVEWLGSTFWSIVIALLALAVLAMRAILRAVLRRLTASDRVGPLETRLRALVADTRSDVLAELRRIGLPGRTATLPLLALRLLGRERRRRTVARLRTFDLDRVVPKARVDELHLLLRGTLGR
jgi:hypothetical protein